MKIAFTALFSLAFATAQDVAIHNGGDPYELRILPGGWIPDSAEHATIVENGPVLRVKVDSLSDGEIHWKVKFHAR